MSSPTEPSRTPRSTSIGKESIGISPGDPPDPEVTVPVGVAVAAIGPNVGVDVAVVVGMTVPVGV
jgi:hypothetical protein